MHERFKASTPATTAQSDALARTALRIAQFRYWGIGLGTERLLAFRGGVDGTGVWPGSVVGLSTAILPLLRIRAQKQLGYLMLEVSDPS